MDQGSLRKRYLPGVLEFPDAFKVENSILVINDHHNVKAIGKTSIITRKSLDNCEVTERQIKGFNNKTMWRSESSCALQETFK